MKTVKHDIFIKNEQRKMHTPPALKALIKEAVTTTLVVMGFDGRAEVSVTLTDDRHIHELNLRFRDIDRPTDVLSFPLLDGDDDDVPPDDATPIGDIVISLERADFQAKEYGHSFEREVAFLSVHSTLHLLGLDHEEGRAEESEMFALQEQILSQMGLERK